MSRHTIFNIVLAVVAVGLVGAVIALEVSESESAATTTTTTTTLPPTTTTSSTTTTSTSTTTTTLPPTTLPPTTLPPPDRATVPVVVSSAGLAGERVGPTAYTLGTLGWSDIRGVNGSVVLPGSVVYFADGFQNAAELLALDAGLPVSAVAPLEEAPPVAGLGTALLLLYLGGA